MRDPRVRPSIRLLTLFLLACVVIPVSFRPASRPFVDRHRARRLE